MFDYNKIIAMLAEEADSCNYRYRDMVPAY